MSFSHKEPLSQNSLHKSPKSQPQVFEEASQTSHNPCFVPPDSELPIGLCFLITLCLNHLRLLTAMNSFSVYSMRHLAGQCLPIHSVALWGPFPWILPIFSLRENPCSHCLPNRKVILANSYAEAEVMSKLGSCVFDSLRKHILTKY